MEKFKYLQFFKSRKVRDIADLIVTKIESTNQYYIHKDRYNYSDGDVINEDMFKLSFNKAKRPIILSDSYIDLV